MKDLRSQLRIWAQRLQSATTQAEREGIVATMEGLENSIEWREEMLSEEGCYLGSGPPVVTRLTEIVHLELTQSTQFYAAEGTGSARDNSVTLVEGKPLLVRAYLKSWLNAPDWAAGGLDIFGYNPTTSRYDLLRSSVAAMDFARILPMAVSGRSSATETLNFLVPAAHCWGRIEVRVQAWVTGHEYEPAGTNPSYHASGSQYGQFLRRRVPILHCFRINLSQVVPGNPNPVAFAPPAFGACVTTMARGLTMFPLSALDVRDRGSRDYSGRLQVDTDYDAVRADIQGLCDATTPTPADNELFVAMLPRHREGATVWGYQLAQSLESVVDFDVLFAHELGHWLIPGDDHVADPGCPPHAGTDPNYPDYPNVSQRAGIGEWGVDTGRTPLRVIDPETADVMSNCGNRDGISPYHYLLALSGPVLSFPARAEEARTGAQGKKLLVALRVYREGTAELRWALHLPGEAPAPSPKGQTDVSVELYDGNGALLVSAPCHRPADRGPTGPYEDFQEVLPWFEDTDSVAAVRGGTEIARWPVEPPPQQPLVETFTVTTPRRADGAAVIEVTWEAPEEAAPSHYLLRYSPDSGRTWIPLANAIEGTRVRVEPELLRGMEDVRFQLAVSTGFRTSLIESRDTVTGPPHQPAAAILQPVHDATLVAGSPVWLVGTVAGPLDGRDHARVAHWVSSRDGFLADGLHTVVPGLSAGGHELRLVVQDASGAALVATRHVRVIDPSREDSA